MMLFGLILLLTILAVVALVLPLLRNKAPVAAGTAHDLEVYQDQLAELKRDVERGAILPEEEEAARLEINRRILALDKKSDNAETSSGQMMTMVIIGCIGLLPMAAGGIYLLQGAPEQQAQPFATRETPTATVAAEAEGMHSEVAGMIDTLSERLQQNPEDLDGWALLARSLIQLQRYEEAIPAYREANRLAGGRDKQLAAEYAEILVIANDGVVGPESRQIFEIFLEEDENDPQAIYYLAMAKAQEGRVEEALADWRRLEALSPPGAAWLPAVREQIATLGGTAPLPGSDDRFAGPSQEQVEAITALPADQQQSIIEGMVAGLAARLEENPDDLEGWRRLARSYTVLGRTEEAKAAYEQVLRLAPDDPDAKAALGL